MKIKLFNVQDLVKRDSIKLIIKIENNNFLTTKINLTRKNIKIRTYNARINQHFHTFHILAEDVIKYDKCNLPSTNLV